MSSTAINRIENILSTLGSNQTAALPAKSDDDIVIVCIKNTNL